MSTEYICRSCGRTFVRANTLQRKCGLCSWNSNKKRKPMKRIGPVTKKWIATRQAWIKDNPGPYACFYCGKKLEVDEMELDHRKSRSRNPELRYNMDNLVPSCHSCNYKKGSRDVD